MINALPWRTIPAPRPGIPPVADLPRYRIYNIAFGKYPVEPRKIHLAKGVFIKYGGASVDSFSAEITTQIEAVASRLGPPRP
jgi:hypothetical protein